MSESPDREKKEIDATNDLIRDYEESTVTGEEGNQTTMAWYEQGNQETTVPPEAVLTGGDIDAAWDQAAVGEETVGGSNPTPDQDIVDEIGRAVGVNYEDAEPLNMTEKLERRDDQRWELNPASSEDFNDRSQSYDTSPPPAGESATEASGQQNERKAA